MRIIIRQNLIEVAVTMYQNEKGAGTYSTGMLSAVGTNQSPDESREV